MGLLRFQNYHNLAKNMDWHQPITKKRKKSNMPSSSLFIPFVGSGNEAEAGHEEWNGK